MLFFCNTVLYWYVSLFNCAIYCHQSKLLSVTLELHSPTILFIIISGSCNEMIDTPMLLVVSLNYVARPPEPSDPNLDQNYDIFVGTILAFNANVLHTPNRVRSEIRKDPSVTLFFGRTSLSNRNIVLAILLLAGDVHPNPGPINRETIYPCGYCQQHVGWSCSGVVCETCNVWYHRECVSITHSHYLALNNSAHVWICFKCQTPNFSNSSISITGSPEINFNSQNSFAVLSDLTGKDDVFLKSLLATLFNPPLFSTPTGDTSSFSNIRHTLTLSDPGYFKQLTIRGGGGGFKSPPPPPYNLENYCVNLHHIIHVHFTRCFRHVPIGIFQKFAILTILQRLQGSARPEVRGTAEPHGGAYPP